MPRVLKSVDAHSSLIVSELYPSRLRNAHVKGHDVILGIGGNVGDVFRRFEHLYHFLVQSSFGTIIETSPIFRNPPFGYLKQGDFYNAVIHLRTHMAPLALLRYILRVEKHFGRKRSIENGPRTLDIDMIFYDQRRIDHQDLNVPHPHWQERDSVLVPLSYLKGTAWWKRLL